MMKFARLLGLAATALAVAIAPASAAPRRPLVIVSGQTQTIPATDTIQAPTPSTSNASVNLPHGSPPTSPVDGDVWTTSSGLYVRIMGATVGPLSAGGSPGGSSGQIQYNNAGAFGGFTMAGDCTFSVPNVTCTKTGGDPFVASATTDTTDASNISSGSLALARIAAMTANTVLGNAMGSSAAPTGLPMPSCSGSANALKWTSASGFGCQTFAASATTDTTNASNISSGSLALGRIASIGANTVLANPTGSSAAPSAASVPSCSGASNALNYTSGTGFGCATFGGAGTPGAVTLITETVTSGSATNVSFTSIPATYRDLEVRIRGRATKSATFVDIRLRLNSDTGANYDGETVQAFGTSVIGFGGLAGTSAYIGNLAAASAPSGVADNIKVEIGDYRGTTFQKAAQYGSSLKLGLGGASQLFTEKGSFWWRSTSAVTQIDVFPSGGGFVDGTVVSLYGHY